MQFFLRLILLATLMAAAAAGVGAGEIYRWTDADGRVHFGDAPPKHLTAESITLQYNTMEALPRTTSLPAVVVYSTVWCGVCAKAKEFLRARAVPFTEYDVETSRQGQADYRRLQGRGVPIILVGEERLNGFRAETLTAALQRAGHLAPTP